ncbi:MAG TPA: response regulator [Ktedonobacteraceae bacterium]|nr:response regulator [Ktedonobacteraceae bacterium]
MNKLVMVIDDSLTVRKIVEVSLRREGIACISYASGIEAIRSLTKQQDLVPDVVILDIGLPQVDGYRVARYMKMKHRYRNTTIIILSGHSSVLDRLKGRLSGAKEYLIKPFTTQEMMALVHAYLQIGPISA